ncbi:MAG: hypothetical protein HGA80_00635 [Candidatus Omnitrophica bacterium]|nr:hypothetical protein [Candidatus Omnitrophota bacterium]
MASNLRAAAVLLMFCVLSSTAFAADSCLMQPCQGLELSCIESAPQACTAMYRLGDFCRQFAGCERVDGECRLVKAPEFAVCQSCVQECERIKEPVLAFDCEAGCRRKYERTADSDQK